MEVNESQNSKDERTLQLWKKLDPQNKGELDFNGLKKGLIRIDHRKQSPIQSGWHQIADLCPALKNANDMLRDVVKAMDKNGDQVIQYEGMSCIVSWWFCLALQSVQYAAWLTAIPLQSFAYSSSGPRRSYFHSSIALIETTMAN
jgi:hypothetical protein